MLQNKVNIFFHFTLICITVFAFSCSKETDDKIVPPVYTISYTIDSALNPSGTRSLMVDKNGFYHMPLNPSTNQSFSRITGRVLVNRKPNPIPSPVDFRVEWESDHYWLLKPGDNVAMIYKTYFNPYTGKLTTVELGLLKSYASYLVPTVNGTSYSNSSTGEINTIFGPIYAMKGDTVTVVGNLKYSMEVPVDKLFSKIIFDSIQRVTKFVLE
ncbi:MAG: hypothetical protein NTZ82_07890 [Bacteroidetes bacterium]|nr:hypothetical protein [Bacteroidota bacterium]